MATCLTYYCSGQKNTKQVVEYLATVFPAMFKDEDAAGLVPSYVGYGLGGLKGLKGLPERVCNMVCLELS